MQSLLKTEHSALLLHENFVYGDTYFHLADQLPLIHYPEINLFGKIVHQHRDVKFFSNKVTKYRYSGQDAFSDPLPEFLEQLMNEINRQHSLDFNSILINRYNDGTDYIGSHADDESNVVPGSSVGTLSLGATRTFRIRDKTGKIVLDYPMKNGDLILMCGQFQREFKHEIPVQKKIKEPRISLTFRQHYPS